MQALSQCQRTRAKSAIALLLTFVAGVVDIVGYITVVHLFTANMTGNTVHFGNKLATGDWTDAAKAGTAIASFVAGSIIGRAVIEAGARKKLRSVAAVTLAMEAVLIVIFVRTSASLNLVHSSRVAVSPVCGLLALLAAAMGLQTATLTRIGPLTIHTTFVTGMLNKMAQAASEWLFWIHDEQRKGVPVLDVVRRSGGHSAFRVANFMFAIWFCYMVGAVAGTFMNLRWNVRTLYLPVVLLAMSAMVDRFRPLTVEEESEHT